MEAIDVSQRAARPNNLRHRLAVRFRRVAVLPTFQASEPRISLFRGHVQTGCPIVLPGSQRILVELLLPLLALEKLVYGIAHQLLGRSAARGGEATQS